MMQIPSHLFSYPCKQNYTEAQKRYQHQCCEGFGRSSADGRAAGGLSVERDGLCCRSSQVFDVAQKNGVWRFNLSAKDECNETTTNLMGSHYYSKFTVAKKSIPNVSSDNPAL